MEGQPVLCIINLIYRKECISKLAGSMWWSKGSRPPECDHGSRILNSSRGHDPLNATMGHDPLDDLELTLLQIILCQRNPIVINQGVNDS